MSPVIHFKLKERKTWAAIQQQKNKSGNAQFFLYANQCNITVNQRQSLGEKWVEEKARLQSIDCWQIPALNQT